MTILRCIGALLLGALTACGVDSGPSEPTGESKAAADCSALIRYDERIYAASSPAIRAPESTTWPLLPGVVEVSECDDVGPDAQGAYFPEVPQTHPPVKLPGIEPERALGYRVDLRKRTVVVLAIAETLSPANRDALIKQFLAGP